MPEVLLSKRRGGLEALKQLVPNEQTGKITFSVALNVKYDEDKAFVEMVNPYLEQGYSIRQIVTDAVLRAGGCTPEMFGRVDELGDAIRAAMQPLLDNQQETLVADIVAELRKMLQSGAVSLPVASESEDVETSDWDKNFARAFMKSRGR